MVKVVVDAFGADKGVGVVVEGAINALVTYDDVNIVIVGDKAEIETELGKFTYDKSRIEVEDAREKITNNESPTRRDTYKKGLVARPRTRNHQKRSARCPVWFLRVRRVRFLPAEYSKSAE